MKVLYYFLVFSLFILSCRPLDKFTKRHYTGGRYKPDKYRIFFKKTNEAPVAIQVDSVEKPLVKEKSPDVISSAEKKENDHAHFLALKPAGREKHPEEIERKPPVKLKDVLVAQKEKDKVQKSREKGKNKLRFLPLAAVVSSGLGFYIDDYMLEGMIEHFFVASLFNASLLSIAWPVAVGLGLIGLILGIVAVRSYKKDQNKNKTTLILGMISIALGAAVILLALLLPILASLLV